MVNLPVGTETFKLKPSKSDRRSPTFGLLLEVVVCAFGVELIANSKLAGSLELLVVVCSDDVNAEPKSANSFFLVSLLSTNGSGCVGCCCCCGGSGGGVCVVAPNALAKSPNSCDSSSRGLKKSSSLLLCGKTQSVSKLFVVAQVLNISSNKSVLLAVVVVVMVVLLVANKSSSA